MTKYYNHGQKSYDTILFVGLFQFTHAQPLPHPTNNVRRLYPEFFPSILQHSPKDFCPGDTGNPNAVLANKINHLSEYH